MLNIIFFRGDARENYDIYLEFSYISHRKKNLTVNPLQWIIVIIVLLNRQSDIKSGIIIRSIANHWSSVMTNDTFSIWKVNLNKKKMNDYLAQKFNAEINHNVHW